MSKQKQQRYINNFFSTFNILIFFSLIICFFPQTVQSQSQSQSQIVVVVSSYTIIDMNKTDNGIYGTLKYNKMISGSMNIPLLYPEIIENLKFEFGYVNENILRLKIIDYDQTKKRYQVPDDVIIIENDNNNNNEIIGRKYDVKINEIGEKFSYQVIRKKDKYIVFDSYGYDFYYCNQYIEVTTKIIEKKPHFYGLGERKTQFHLNSNANYTVWTKKGGRNYGAHPFYMQVLDDGKTAHGMFYLNSNAMMFEINSNKGFLKWRTIGGIVDIFFLLGDGPKDVTKQFQEIIGKPFLPPYWSMGNQQSRFGYMSLNITKNIVKKFKEYEFPLDAIWNDLDYMDHLKDFTNNRINFPKQEYIEFIDELHENNQHYVQILDPAIKNETGYDAFEIGIEMDAFVKRYDQKGYIHNLLWAGYSVWVDFFSERGFSYWNKMISNHFKEFKLSGIWLDMNEIDAFCKGECYPFDKNNNLDNERNIHRFSPMNPPWLPNGIKDLNEETLRMDSIMDAGIMYDLHSLYGFQESKATFEAFQKSTNQRAFLISRSTFSGSNRFTGHWLGDSMSNFGDLKLSVSQILTFSIFGFHMTGADICGFGGSTTEELCTRWYELASFGYGFMRNHNNLGTLPQEPWVFGKTLLESSKKATLMRYSLLPYFYSLHFLGHVQGDLFIRPLFFEFSDSTGILHYVDTQFMIGNALMVSPSLDEDSYSVNAYIPNSRWFDLFTGIELLECTKMEYCKLDSPIDYINVHVRGGSIIPMKNPELTTTETRHNSFHFLIALDENNSAEGFLYIDDGISIDSIEKENYSSIRIQVIEKNDNYNRNSNNTSTLEIFSKIDKNNFSKTNTNIDKIIIFGMKHEYIKSIKVNGKEFFDFEFNPKIEKLSIYDLQLTVLDPFVIDIIYDK